MKAVFFEKNGGIENIRVGSLPPPSSDLKEGFVRLRFLAGGLNHLDLWVLKGLPRVQYHFPQIAGADLCALVTESKSARFKVNDRVVLYPAESEGKNLAGAACPENLASDFHIRGENMTGVFCEELIANERYVFSAPEHLSNAECAAFPLMYLTAWQMITEKADLQPKQSSLMRPLLVFGAGSGVSQALLEILLQFGAKKIATVSREPAKLSDWKARGVEGFVFDESLEKNLKAWAGSERISCIFDHLGERVFEMSTRLLTTGGKYITCGATTGFEGKIDLRHLYFRQLQFLGSTMGSLHHFQELLQWVISNRIRPRIGHRFSLEEAQKAYRLMDEGLQNGKIVLEPNQKTV